MKSEPNGGQGNSALLITTVCLTATLLAVTPRAHAVSLSVSSAEGSPGDRVEICVDLAAGGQEVAGVQADLVWSADCAEIEASSCRKGDHEKQLHKRQLTNSRLRMIVLSLQDTDPIPDGSRLFCCDFVIRPDTGATSCPVTLQSAAASDGVGNPVAADPFPGTILVRGGPAEEPAPRREVARPAAPAASGVAAGVGEGGAAPAGSVGSAPASAMAPEKKPVVVVPGEAEAERVAETAAEAAGGAAETAREAARKAAEALGERLGRHGAEVGEVATTPRAKAAEPPTQVATKPAAASTKRAPALTPTAQPTAPPATRTRAPLATPTERREESACQLAANPRASDARVLLLAVGILLLFRHRRRTR